MNTLDHLSLLVTAGDGPSECNQAVEHVLERMEEEAEMFGLSLSIHRSPGHHGPKSGVVLVHGEGRMAFAKSWVGAIQWRMQSQLRRHHKRSNWFVGVFAMDPAKTCVSDIQPNDVTFSTLRAGGPGGQHQNTTDSAVRAIHKPTDLTVVVREARSQHRNKALALERLQNLADAQSCVEQEAAKTSQNRLHHGLERGNPVRRFVGKGFKEDLK